MAKRTIDWDKLALGAVYVLAGVSTFVAIGKGIRSYWTRAPKQLPSPIK